MEASLFGRAVTFGLLGLAIYAFIEKILPILPYFPFLVFVGMFGTHVAPPFIQRQPETHRCFLSWAAKAAGVA